MRGSFSIAVRLQRMREQRNSPPVWEGCGGRSGDFFAFRYFVSKYVMDIQGKGFWNGFVQSFVVREAKLAQFGKWSSIPEKFVYSFAELLLIQVVAAGLMDKKEFNHVIGFGNYNAVLQFECPHFRFWLFNNKYIMQWL